jgi:hypothetical protein
LRAKRPFIFARRSSLNAGQLKALDDGSEERTPQPQSPPTVGGVVAVAPRNAEVRMTRLALLALASTALLAGVVAAPAQAATRAKKTKVAPPPDPTPVPAPVAPAADPAAPPNLDFDLLAPPEVPGAKVPPIPKEPVADPALVARRRLMLNLHQTLGIGLAAAEAGAVITGQLSYGDKFDGPNSGRYRTAHQAFVYSTLGLAAVVTALGVFAPVPIDKKTSGFDRMMLHKIGVFTAAAGWAAELGLGLYTASREGYVNQRTAAAAHLAIGYVTLAGLLLGVGAITF